ncbi:MAG: hypothetical protein M1839_000564 [Geoglossum umbratile]|nr:MAG: hypothetical protein M1839_000564 [Geoglossum umbratile]
MDTNQSDNELVIGWLEILLKIVPSIRTRDILNTIDNPIVGTCLHEESGIAIDKNKGIVTANGKIYGFNPLPSKTAGNSASGAHVCIKGHYEAELSYALRRVEVIEGDRGVKVLARGYHRDGEYKIAEVLHQQLLAGKEKTLSKGNIDTVLSVTFLAESLEKQGQYKEAEELDLEKKTAKEIKAARKEMTTQFEDTMQESDLNHHDIEDIVTTAGLPASTEKGVCIHWGCAPVPP